MSPIKPTRDDAAHAPDVAEMNAEEGLQEERSAARQTLGRGRDPRGSDEEQEREVPHVGEGVENAPVQDTISSPVPIEPLPANASGRDRVSTEEEPKTIDPESAYDGRPSQDKDRPPSARTD